MESLDILRELVGFPTLSSAPNRALIEAASARLTAAGAQVRLIENEDGTKANLYATLGQDDRPGVLLSGHTDVVPVEGQDWTRDPFALAVEDGCAYGRGGVRRRKRQRSGGSDRRRRKYAVDAMC